MENFVTLLFFHIFREVSSCSVKTRGKFMQMLESFLSFPCKLFFIFTFAFNPSLTDNKLNSITIISFQVAAVFGLSGRLYEFGFLQKRVQVQFWSGKVKSFDVEGTQFADGRGRKGKIDYIAQFLLFYAIKLFGGLKTADKNCDKMMIRSFLLEFSLINEKEKFREILRTTFDGFYCRKSEKR